MYVRPRTKLSTVMFPVAVMLNAMNDTTGKAGYTLTV